MNDFFLIYIEFKFLLTGKVKHFLLKNEKVAMKNDSAAFPLKEQYLWREDGVQIKLSPTNPSTGCEYPSLRACEAIRILYFTGYV
jgi:hypothetical protein